MFLKKYGFLFYFFLLCAMGFSQTPKLDSLLKVLPRHGADTNRMKCLNSISRNYASAGLFDSTLSFAKQALDLAKELSPTRSAKAGIGIAHNNLGLGYWNKGDYPSALKHFTSSLESCQELNDKKGIGRCYGNIGLIYWTQGNYPKALDYDLKALKIDEEMGDKSLISVCLGNIGLVYWNQAEYGKAREYFERALKIDEGVGNKAGVARHTGNIGNLYAEQKDYKKALEFYFKALKISETAMEYSGMTDHLGNIGSIYTSLKDYNKALEYQQKALDASYKMGDKSRIALTLGNMGMANVELKKYKEAEELLKRSLAMFDSIHYLQYIMQMQGQLSELYSKTGRPAEALEYYKKSIQIKDSIYNDESKKQIVQKEMNFEFEKKEAAARAEQDKKDLLTEQEKHKQKIIMGCIVGGLVLVLFFAVFIFRSYRQKQKANVELMNKNILIEKQKKEVELQKSIIQEKNIQITDSIEYASNIQNAIIPSGDRIREFLPGSFVLFMPKDIVSGDFYWLHAKNNEVLFAAIDCIGHGVPGAFMSVMAFNMLENIVGKENISAPAAILDRLNDTVINTLQEETENTSIKYGMDISLISLNKERNKVCFAGAHNSLYHVRDKKLQELKADRTTIGMARDKFTEQKVALQTGDMLYLYTDGFADQKGGPEGKKYFMSTFKDLLISVSGEESLAQKEKLQGTLRDWKREMEQIDDILLVGIRV